MGALIENNKTSFGNSGKSLEMYSNTMAETVSIDSLGTASDLELENRGIENTGSNDSQSKVGTCSTTRSNAPFGKSSRLCLNIKWIIALLAFLVLLCGSFITVRAITTNSSNNSFYYLVFTIFIVWV